MESLLERIPDTPDSLWYVANYLVDKLISCEKQGTENSSSSELNRYEELIVNPTILKLGTQLGNIL